VTKIYLRAATAVLRRTKNIQTPPQLQLWATQLELSDAEIDERSKTLNDQKYGLNNQIKMSSFKKIDL